MKRKGETRKSFLPVTDEFIYKVCHGDKKAFWELFDKLWDFYEKKRDGMFRPSKAMLRDNHLCRVNQAFFAPKEENDRETRLVMLAMALKYGDTDAGLIDEEYLSHVTGIPEDKVNEIMAELCRSGSSAPISVERKQMVVV